MFVQTEVTPNPNSLKFLPGKIVSNSGPYEITKKDDVQNDLVRNILSVNGVVGIFLGLDFISVNKNDQVKWEEIKHIVILYILGILFGAVFLDIWGAETNIKKGLIAMFWTALFLIALIFVEKNKEEN